MVMVRAMAARIASVMGSVMDLVVGDMIPMPGPGGIPMPGPGGIPMPGPGGIPGQGGQKGGNGSGGKGESDPLPGKTTIRDNEGNTVTRSDDEVLADIEANPMDEGRTLSIICLRMK